MNELLQTAWPQLSILLTACLVLLWGLCRADNPRAGVYVIATLGIVLTLCGTLLHTEGASSISLSGQLIYDDLAKWMHIAILSVVLVVLVYGAAYLNTYQIPVTETVVLMLFSTVGMMVLVCANTMLTTFLGLEILSLPLYALTAIRRMHAGASEAALKYFVMGAMASGLLLYGFSLLYGITGQMMFQSIAMGLSTSAHLPQGLLWMALVFIVAGLAFKLAAVPFHMWAPDVYEGAPLASTLLISSAPKIAGLTVLLRVLMVALPVAIVPWQSIIGVIAVLSIVLGNICAIVQTNIRRLLAYSAISHTGFILLGVSCATTAGYSSAVYYLLVYMVMTVAAFGLLTLLSREGRELEEISELKGLNDERPWAAFMLLIVLFSMAGVPPTAGFFVKLAILKALIETQQVALSIFVVLMAVVGAFYYLWIVKVMYFDEKESLASFELGGRLGRALFSCNCLALLYFGIFPAGLMALCSSLFVA